MKKLLVFFLCALTTLVGCKQQGSNEADDSNLWASMVKKYTMLENFPPYSHEMKNVVYLNSGFSEPLQFVDMNCPKSYYDDYKETVAKAGFTTTIEGEGDSVDYELQKGDKTYVVILSYSGSTLMCQYVIHNNN